MWFTWLCQHLVWYLFRDAGLELGRDYTVNDDSFYRDLVLRGSLGLGESYMEGKWSTTNLHYFFRCLFTARKLQFVQWLWSWLSPVEWWRWLVVVYGPRFLVDAHKVGKVHYDLDPQLYQEMLSTPMMYSCAYWKDVETLEEAQLQKMDLLARKLELKEGMRVLDIGCGWGDMAIFLAQKYGCKVVGLTISKEQQRIAKERAVKAGVEDKVTYLLQDYREHREMYDRVVSIGMLEHVNFNNLTAYFKCVERFLHLGGLAVIHSITGRTNTPVGDGFISKHIFPNSAIPSHEAWISSLRPVDLEIEDIQSLGPDYSRTLEAWRVNFEKYCAGNLSLTEVRMWRYYLTASEVQFDTRGLQLWQVVLSSGRTTRYDAPR